MHVVNDWIERMPPATYFWTKWNVRSPLEKKVIAAASIFFGCLCLYWVYKGVTGSEETKDKAEQPPQNTPSEPTGEGRETLSNDSLSEQKSLRFEPSGSVASSLINPQDQQYLASKFWS